MPSEKKIYKNIPKIYRYEAIDNWLFAYVIAYRRCGDASLKDTLLMFAKDFGLSEDEYPLDSMLQKWYNMAKDYLNEEKSH